MSRIISYVLIGAVIILAILSVILSLTIYRKNADIARKSKDLERYEQAYTLSQEACNETIEAIREEQIRAEEKHEQLEQTIEDNKDWGAIRLPVDVSRMCESLCGYTSKTCDP